MSTLLRVSAVIELPAGLAMAAAPNLVRAVLLGSSSGTPAESVTARVAGASIIPLGLACWLVGREGPSGAVL